MSAKTVIEFEFSNSDEYTITLNDDGHFAYNVAGNAMDESSGDSGRVAFDWVNSPEFFDKLPEFHRAVLRLMLDNEVTVNALRKEKNAKFDEYSNFSVEVCHE